MDSKNLMTTFTRLAALSLALLLMQPAAFAETKYVATTASNVDISTDDLTSLLLPLTQSQLVAEAADPASPLHHLFEWDDAVAAHGYRVEQATHLIRRYKITINVEPDRVVRVRQFMHVGSRSGYVPAAEALVSHRDEIFAEAVIQMEALRAKYDTLVDIEAAWNTARRAAAKKRGKQVAS